MRVLVVTAVALVEVSSFLPTVVSTVLVVVLLAIILEVMVVELVVNIVVTGLTVELVLEVVEMASVENVILVLNSGPLPHLLKAVTTIV